MFWLVTAVHECSVTSKMYLRDGFAVRSELGVTVA